MQCSPQSTTSIKSHQMKLINKSMKVFMSTTEPMLDLVMMDFPCNPPETAQHTFAKLPQNWAESSPTLLRLVKVRPTSVCVICIHGLCEACGLLSHSWQDFIQDDWTCQLRVALDGQHVVPHGPYLHLCCAGTGQKPSSLG